MKWRTLGLILIVLTLMFVLRPGLFINIFSKPKEAKTDQVVNQDPAAPIDGIQVANNTTTVPNDTSKSLYAPGYDASYFDKGNLYNMDETVMQPQGGPWETLLKMQMEQHYDKVNGNLWYEYKFTPEIKALDGKEITLKGFIIPMEEAGKQFVFSAYPYTSCFFCGQAGPESVAEVYPSKPIPYTKDVTQIKGILKLNPTDQNKLPYIIEKAQPAY